MITCQTSKGSSAKHWSWRSVDGKTCWYAGQRHLDKSQLTWKLEPVAANEVVVGEQKHYTREELAPSVTAQAQAAPDLPVEKPRIEESFAAVISPRPVRTVLFDSINRELQTKKVTAVVEQPAPPPPLPAYALPLRNVLEVPGLLLVIAMTVLLWRAVVSIMVELQKSARLDI
jgi:hypothetical protein